MIHNEFGPAVINLDLKSVSYYINGKKRTFPLPYIVTYDLAGSIKDAEYIPEPGLNIHCEQYIDELGNRHSLSGPAIYFSEKSGNSDMNKYMVHGTIIDKKEWENHSEVSAYKESQLKINLKNKMQQVFGVDEHASK